MIGNVLAAHNQIGGVLATGRSPSAGFVGAYDAIPNIVAAYGMRRLLTTYTGPILRMRRSSDNAEQDIGYEADGDLDTAAVATFIGAGSGYIRTWYEQSGNAYNATQTTAANQPLYVASGQNDRPMIRFDGANDSLFAQASATTYGTFSFLVVEKMISGNYPVMVGELGNQVPAQSAFLERFSANRIDVGTGFSRDATATLTGIATYNAWHILSTIVNVDLNGTAVFSDGIAATMGLDTGGNNTFATKLSCYFGTVQNLAYGQVDISELIICNAALSDANRIAAEAAANAYWAIF